MGLYNKHKHRKRWAMLVAAKHQTPSQHKAEPTHPQPTASCRGIWAAKGQNPWQCCAAPQQCSLWWASLEAGPAPPPSPRFGTQRLARARRGTGLVLARQTALLMHSTVTHPWIIESWLQCSAESLGKTTDTTWANPGPMSNRIFCTI